MLTHDPSRRHMNEYRTIALDLAGRISGIETAMRLKPALFNRDQVIALRDFAQEAQRQRGGAVFAQDAGASPQQVADDLATSVARIDNLSNKLRRSRFSRDALVVAGTSVRCAGGE